MLKLDILKLSFIRKLFEHEKKTLLLRNVSVINWRAVKRRKIELNLSLNGEYNWYYLVATLLNCCIVIAHQPR